MNSTARNYPDERLTVGVVPEMQNAVRHAAERRGVSVACFVRRAIGAALAVDGVTVPAVTADHERTISIMRESRRPDQIPQRVSLRGGETWK